MNLQTALSQDFWTNHHKGDLYEMVNRDKTVSVCEIVYYPLDDYKDFKALVNVKGRYNSDYREVPVRFLKKIETPLFI
jgi:hypothetical protein